MKSRGIANLVVCGTFILVGCLSLAAFVRGPALIRELAMSRSGITKGTLSADLFATIPFDLRQNIYVFNITNIEDFFNGGKPHLQQLGPYVFRVGLRKQMSWSEGDLLTYRENRNFWFDAGLSNGSLSDTIYTVDAVYAAAQEAIDELPNFIKALVIPLLQSRKVLFKRTVGELLYDGYSDALADLAHMIRPDLPVIDGKIGYLRSQNNTDDGDITVFAGTQASTRNKTNVILRWQDKESIPYYSGECSRLWGTNGELYPGFSLASPPSTIGVFLPMFCRPWPLHFSGTRWENGIELAVFRSGLDIFSPTNDSHIEECAQPGVWPRGVFDIKACQHGFPALVSLPHFLHADENILNDVDGLEPNITKHDFHVDLFPLLGVPVRPVWRAQLNVRILRHFDSIRSANPPVVYPVLWQEITLSESAVSYVSTMIWYVIRLPQFVLQVVSLALLVMSLSIVIAYAISRKMTTHSAEDTSEESQTILDSADDIDTTPPAICI